ncbi:MAG: hypothetical protein ACI9MC_001034 [Kiritimatiellia bacterium]|jgi:hypothetical protein
MRILTLIGSLLISSAALAGGSPDLALTWASGDYLPSSDQVSYKIEVTNEGSVRSAATHVELYGAKDSNITMCKAYNHWTLPLPALDPGASTAVVFKVAAGYADPGPLWSFVDLERTSGDRDLTNNLGVVVYWPTAAPARVSRHVFSDAPPCVIDKVDDEYGVLLPVRNLWLATLLRVL